MPNYTTAARVKAVIAVDEEVDVEMFITDAHTLMANVIGTAVTDTATLETVERYLTAHMLASTLAPLTASEGAGPVNESYQYKLGEGLASTTHGRLAMQMDPSGKLAKWSKQVESGVAGGKPGVFWLGTTEA